MYGAATDATTAATATDATIQPILNANIVRTASGRVMHFGLDNAGEAMSRDIVIYKGSRQFVVDVIKDLEKRLDALEGDDGEKGKAMSNEREAFEAAWEEFQDKDLTSSNRIQAHAWFLKGYRSASQSADDEFKNFHRLLCERFGYSHDEKHWKRDQLSLIEWIAARQSAGANESTLRVLSSHAIRKHEGVTIFGDPAQVLKVMAAIESAGATGHEAVGIIERDEVNGWHMNALVDWEKIGIGTKLYAAPLCDNRAMMGVLNDILDHCDVPANDYSRGRIARIAVRELKRAAQPAGGSSSAAWDYGNRLVNAKLDPSYAQPSNEPIPQHLEGQSYDAWDAFQKHPASQMSNSDDFWPIWRDAWDAAREQPAESKRAELTDDEIAEVWTGVSGRPLYKGSVADSFARALLARASDKGE